MLAGMRRLKDELGGVAGGSPLDGAPGTAAPIDGAGR
jgi:hypothetical protein